MAQDVISTLFGITPRNVAFDQYTQERMIDVNKAGSQYADLGRANIERASAMMQNAGTGLGIGIGRLLGGQTPQMAEEQRVQGMLGGASLQDPEQLMMAAERFAQAGDIPRAQALQTKATELFTTRQKAQEAEAAAAAKQAAYQNRIRALKSRLPDMPDAEAEALAADEVAFREFFKESKIKYSSDVEEISAELFGKPFNQLTPSEAKQVNLLKEERGVKKASAGASRVSVGGPDIAGILKEVGAKEDAKGKAENWAKAGDAYKMQVPMLEQLDEVTRLLPRTFTGSFANTSLQFGKALSGLGIPIDETKLTNTEYLNAVSAQLLQTIARNFPGALAVKEMDQLIKSKPNSQQQVTTIVKILDGLKTEMKSNILAYEELAKLPEGDRYSKNFNIVQADSFRKLKRYESLIEKANKAKADTTGRTKLTKEEIAEAQRLQQELGEK